MGDRTASGNRVSGSITGNVTGQVAIGERIEQRQFVGAATAVSEAELAQLREAFTEARTRVAELAPPHAREAAAERLDELEETIESPEPDVTTMAYVKGWFARRLPELAGIITGLLVHPVLGRVVEAAGESVASEFRRRVGEGAEPG